MANKPKRKQYGWSKTKKFPHERHPAYYRYSKKNNDDIEYLTFTHSPRVQIVDEKYKKVYVDTVPLNSNISPRERKKDVFGDKFSKKLKKTKQKTTWVQPCWPATGCD